MTPSTNESRPFWNHLDNIRKITYTKEYTIFYLGNIMLMLADPLDIIIEKEEKQCKGCVYSSLNFCLLKGYYRTVRCKSYIEINPFKLTDKVKKATP